jgi:hypothetical protein
MATRTTQGYPFGRRPKVVLTGLLGRDARSGQRVLLAGLVAIALELGFPAPASVPSAAIPSLVAILETPS